MAVELAILTPLVIVMLLVVVAFGRVTQGRAMVDQAAAAAARSASLAVTPSQARTAAIHDGLDTLTGAGLSCRGASVTVDTSAFRPGGQVSARVACTVDLSAMAMAGVPGTLTLTASATSPLESHRDLGGTP
jgi:Flp pilus assembly protein TadG